MTYRMVKGSRGRVILYEDDRLHDFFDSEADCQSFLDLLGRTDQVKGRLRKWALETASDLDLTYDEVLEEVVSYAGHHLLWEHRHPG